MAQTEPNLYFNSKILCMVTLLKCKKVIKILDY